MVRRLRLGPASLALCSVLIAMLSARSRVRLGASARSAITILYEMVSIDESDKLGTRISSQGQTLYSISAIFILCTSLVNMSTSVWLFGKKITGFGWTWMGFGLSGSKACLS
jgi:hypothetical protein